MSLLLKALKQAENAHAGKPAGGRGDGPRDTDGDALELEPLATTDTEPSAGWVEPPGLLFGNAGPAPSNPRPSRAFRMPQLSLVPVVAVLAGVIAIGYGIYLYFALQPPDTVALPPPSASVPTPTPTPFEPAVAPFEPAPAAAPAVPAAPPSPALREPLPSASIAPTPPAAEAPASKRPVQPITEQAASAVSVPAAPRQQPDASPARPSSSPSEARSRPAQDTPLPAAPIQFQPDAQSGLLAQAHAAYQRGALAEAQRLYTQAAARSRSIDALLGLAAIASVQNRESDAQRLYREVLDINPRNATAQAALLDLLGNTDAPATESRLKLLIDREPSPQLYQTLGNFYADQKRWSDAQAAYFEAYRLAPDNADYAFNLAVSLDQLRQSAAASKYYEKALATGGVHRFDRAQAEARLQQLKAGR